MAAVFSSVNKNNFRHFAEKVIATAGQDAKFDADGPDREAWRRARRQQRRGGVAEVHGYAIGGKFTPGQFTALGAYLDVLDQQQWALVKMAYQGSEEMKEAVLTLKAIYAAARSIAVDGKAAVEHRQLAASILGRGLDEHERDRKLLAGLLTPQTPAEVQGAAVVALGKLRAVDVPIALLAGWKGYGQACAPRSWMCCCRAATGPTSCSTPSATA